MIEKIKAKWALYKEAWPYIRHPGRILYLRDLTDAQRELISVYDAKAWEKEVVRSLKDELDKRKAAMDEEEQAHEAAEEELRKEIADLSQELAEAKAERASALAEKAYLLAERAEWLQEKAGDSNTVQPQETPADC